MGKCRLETAAPVFVCQLLIFLCLNKKSIFKVTMFLASFILGRFFIVGWHGMLIERGKILGEGGVVNELLVDLETRRGIT
jgi:hypothetical protein